MGKHLVWIVPVLLFTNGLLTGCGRGCHDRTNTPEQETSPLEGHIQVRELDPDVRRLLPSQEDLDRLRRLAREDPVSSLWVGSSIIVTKTPWATLRRIPWRLEQEFGYAWHISVSDKAEVGVIGAPEAVPFDTLINGKVPSKGAVVNGGFVDAEGRPLDLIVSHSEVLHPFRSNGGSGIWVVADRSTDIVHRDQWPMDVEHALQSIDRIVYDGESLVQPGNGRRAARVGVVETRTGCEFVILAHGESLYPNGGRLQIRYASGFGLTLGEFTQYILRATDAEKALNLDGGPSLQFRMWTDKYRFVIDAGGVAASAMYIVPATGD